MSTSRSVLDYLPNQKQFWPYKWHSVGKLEFLTYIVTLPLGMMHFLAPQNLYGLLIPGAGFIVLTICWHYFGGLQFRLFRKHILTQFRTMVVICSLLVIITLHTASYKLLITEFNDEGNGNPLKPIIVAIFDDIFWSMVILVLIEADTVYPKPSNLSRLLLPLYATVNCIWSIHNAFLDRQYDVPLISIGYGNITYFDLWKAAYAQLIWFLSGLTFAVFRDPKHVKCSWADTTLLRKRYLTNVYIHEYTKLVRRNICGIYVNLTFPTIFLLILFILLFIPIILLYALDAWGSYERLQWLQSIVLIVLTVFLLLCLLVLLYHHFERHLSYKLLKQFRTLLLVIAMALLTYCMIQKFVWNVNATEGIGDPQRWSQSVIVADVCFHVAYYVAVILMIVRDAVIYTFPCWFTAGFALVLAAVSLLNILRATFSSEVVQYPSWFTFVEKQAYFQIFSMMLVILWRLFVDRKHAYFVLIREQLKRKVLFQEIKAGGRTVFDQHEDEQEDVEDQHDGRRKSNVQLLDIQSTI